LFVFLIFNVFTVVVSCLLLFFAVSAVVIVIVVAVAVVVVAAFLLLSFVFCLRRLFFVFVVCFHRYQLCTIMRLRSEKGRQVCNVELVKTRPCFAAN